MSGPRAFHATTPPEHYLPEGHEHRDAGRCPCGVLVRWDPDRERWRPVARSGPSASALIGGAVLVTFAGYIAAHVIAAATGLPPGEVVGLLVRAVGFAFGSAVFLSLIFQLIRR